MSQPLAAAEPPGSWQPAEAPRRDAEVVQEGGAASQRSPRATGSHLANPPVRQRLPRAFGQQTEPHKSGRPRPFKITPIDAPPRGGPTPRSPAPNGHCPWEAPLQKLFHIESPTPSLAVPPTSSQSISAVGIKMPHPSPVSCPDYEVPHHASLSWSHVPGEVLFCSASNSDSMGRTNHPPCSGLRCSNSKGWCGPG